MRVAALIVAAGRGRRALQSAGTAAPSDSGADETPKQYRQIGGAPMLSHAIKAFSAHEAVTDVLVVIHEGDQERYDGIAAGLEGALDKLRPAVVGGSHRQDSVRSGLEALAADAPDQVLIHDAARPFVDAALIQRVVESLKTTMGALPCLPVTDTLKRSKNGIVTETVDRAGLWRAQTPQGFRFQDILDAHRAAVGLSMNFTDDASIAEWYGLPVAQVEGSEANQKVTTNEDFVLAEARLTGTTRLDGLRVGSGYDVHAFGDGDAVVLGGVSIPHDKALSGHSDADVVLHALTDALLGAIGDGDIGMHFPPSDAQWAGADSAVFITEALRRVTERGGRVINADVTILCEAPKIGPHRDAMRSRIAELLGVTLDRIGVKATTQEGLGAIGRGEGIAAMATVTISLM
ncbi:Bifunctional enzyme IspD/IspF [Methyloligella halotolerans]|uniref:Bifunctional enzyme IspD/IspF n=1 Tax=Methyloligella halotolerans TaxID=1177755 RepID=A0A1E2S1R1_9HYPH|nr:bifunctional 2-C-methyl-D-erythritol 4-phosphate cytidylyltransferase/2-C-methyl-D-erythritol 2,4-cyclodiphosphate synthase [Methyloligella halotolerans]ODA68443.1 Bifunctional enzyme IspD/IspF [Methyloligella halotolerans]